MGIQVQVRIKVSTKIEALPIAKGIIEVFEKINFKPSKPLCDFQDSDGYFTVFFEQPTLIEGE